MRLIIQIFVCSMFLILLSELYGQSIINNNQPLLPLKSGTSVMFGKDIIIDNDQSRDQRQVSLCSSFNGWLYALYSYTKFSTNIAFKIMKSIDNGITWTEIYDDFFPFENTKYTSIDFIISGDSISNLKLFLAFVVSNSESTGLGDAHLLRFNGETGVFEDHILQDNFSHSIALACDYMYPATNSNPRSIGVLYSKYSDNKDSIIFCSSSNGGMTLNNRKVVAASGKYFKKVALTYGRSLSWNSGRYFATWEEKDDFTSNTGHIYTAHTEPDFNSPFTAPVNLDSLDASNINMCRNPVIACQFNNVDNDSSNLTELVLFEKYIPADNKYDIEGFFNKKATNSNHFTQLSINTSSDNKQQPSINFNPFDSTFMVTYYNSTTQKLPFLLNNFNLANPDSWQVVNPGYNDSANLAAPYPRVALDISQQQGVNIWSSEGPGGKGIAMFEAPYSTYTGISGNNTADNKKLFWVYPNPCNSSLTVRFELKNPEMVTITLYNLIGKPVGIITDQCYTAGRHILNYNVSLFPSGSYFLEFRNGTFVSTSKVIIIR